MKRFFALMFGMIVMLFIGSVSAGIHGPSDKTCFPPGIHTTILPSVSVEQNYIFTNPAQENLNWQTPAEIDHPLKSELGEYNYIYASAPEVPLKTYEPMYAKNINIYSSPALFSKKITTSWNITTCTASNGCIF